MYNRRKFIKLSAAGASFAALSKSAIAKTVIAKPEGGYPIVISTWDFGIIANKGAWKVLSAGGRALDAIETGARIPEAEDITNHTVGRTGLPDRDGHVTLDSCIMDEFGNCGSVAAMENIAHPISVARLVMEKTPHVMLVGEGATQFAVEQGMKKEKLLTPETEKIWKEWLKKAQYSPVMNIENGGKPGN
ncbi:isoaspartyl peptidase/L-asparaginase, partial [Mucilaginibacter sp.]|uniref:isoaspartyl peptidase/L-asparaginase n=1 Tax=Mucilaginibacter sp. TaxID=1882438 RepID=UPI002ED27133